MYNFIFSNNEQYNLKKQIEKLENQYDTILIASAFFSESDTLFQIINKNIQVRLIVSLRYPTDYFALEKISVCQNVITKFMPKNFHSKIYVFLKNEIPVAGIIGSSNFTNGGLENNIETDFVFQMPVYCKQLLNAFNLIDSKANYLEPKYLEQYKEIYLQKKKQNETSKNEEDFYNKLKSNQNISHKLSKTVSEYYNFINIINNIKTNLKDELIKYYPGIPPYIVLDHFWHWIKTIWAKDNNPLNEPNFEIIKNMFTEFYKWDQTDKYTLQMFDKANSIFRKYLAKEEIDNLDTEKLKLIYSNLHAGEGRSIRFHSDEAFISKNDIEKIKSSFMYLLYSDDDIITRLDKLTDNNSSQKLNELNTSCVQELVGWVFYDTYPIRNRKSDYAVKYLGYMFNVKTNETH